jgi:hypothetical protein
MKVTVVAITPGWVGRLLAWSALLATALVAALLLEAFAASALVAQGTAAPSDVCATPNPVTAALADGDDVRARFLAHLCGGAIASHPSR